MPKKSAHDEVSSPVITTFFSDTHESSFNKQKKTLLFLSSLNFFRGSLRSQAGQPLHFIHFPDPWDE